MFTPVPLNVCFPEQMEVDRLRGTLKLAQKAMPLGKHTPMKIKIRQARDKALGYSDANFMCGRTITNWRHDFPDGNLPSDDEEDDGEDEDDDEQGNVTMTTGTIAGNITGNKDPHTVQ